MEFDCISGIFGVHQILVVVKACDLISVISLKGFCLWSYYRCNFVTGSVICTFSNKKKESCFIIFFGIQSFRNFVDVVSGIGSSAVLFLFIFFLYNFASLVPVELLIISNGEERSVQNQIPLKGLERIQYHYRGR